jgi:hypothetical protein
MWRPLCLAALAAAIATCAAAPQSTNSSVSLPLVGSGKDSSAGTMFEVNVFYSTSKTPDCQDKADASVQVAPGECICLYDFLTACIASIKLDTTKGTAGDDNLDASVYIGSACAGEPIIGGDTEIPCDTCSVASVLSGGIGIEFVCPFGAWGICKAVGIGLGTPCIMATAVLAGGLLFCVCCGSKFRSKPTRYQQGYIQAPQQGYIQAPQQSGYRYGGSE